MVIKPKKLNCDKTQKIRLLQNSKIWLWQNSKNEIVTKLRKIKLWQNSKKSNCDGSNSDRSDSSSSKSSNSHIFSSYDTLRHLNNRWNVLGAAFCDSCYVLGKFQPKHNQSLFQTLPKLVSRHT